MNKRRKMKKIVLIFALVLFTSSAYAGSCPMLWGKIDSKLTEVQKLRDAGKKAHDEGDHAKSEKLLNEALALLNN